MVSVVFREFQEIWRLDRKHRHFLGLAFLELYLRK